MSTHGNKTLWLSDEFLEERGVVGSEIFLFGFSIKTANVSLCQYLNVLETSKSYFVFHILDPTSNQTKSLSFTLVSLLTVI